MDRGLEHLTNFTERELEIFQDREFLLAKAKILEKVHNLLSITKKQLSIILQDYERSLPDILQFKSAKISKGENYMGLPYLVLDYPAVFTNTHIFAFRTMFWWGNFFSATLHLQGSALDQFRESIIENIERLNNKHIFIGVNTSPWEYHYGKDNYLPIDEIGPQFIREHHFLKLSKKLSLDKWEELPAFSSRFLRTVFEVLV